MRDGLITQVETEPGAGPERKRYEVTDTGRQSVEQWLLTPVTPAGDVQADIFAKTVIALMLDDRRRTPPRPPARRAHGPHA